MHCTAEPHTSELLHSRSISSQPVRPGRRAVHPWPSPAKRQRRRREALLCAQTAGSNCQHAPAEVQRQRRGAHRGPGLNGHRAGRQEALPVYAGRDAHEQPRAAGAALRQRGADAAHASRPCTSASARACLRSGTAARRSPGTGPALAERQCRARHYVQGRWVLQLRRAGVAAVSDRSVQHLAIYAPAHGGKLYQPSGEPGPPAAASTYKTAGAASACTVGGGQRCTHGAAASQRSRRCRVTTWPAVGRTAPACCCVALRTVHARDSGLLCVALDGGICRPMRLTIMVLKDGSGSV
jgi:hypothetical protein